MRLIALAMAWTLAAAAAAGDALGAIRVRVDRGVLHAATVELLGQTITDVSCEPRLEGRVLRLVRLQGALHGGRLEGEVEIDLAAGIYRGRITASGIDLARVLRAQRAAVDDVAGTISASFAFTVEAANPRALTGAGELRIERASLVRLPVLFQLLYAKVEGRSGTDRAQARFTVEGGRIRVEQAQIAFPKGSIWLRGAIGLDGGLDLATSTEFKGGVFRYIPGIGDLAVWVSASIARFSIRGHISNPELRLNPFGRNVQVVDEDVRR